MPRELIRTGAGEQDMIKYKPQPKLRKVNQFKDTGNRSRKILNANVKKASKLIAK